MSNNYTLSSFSIPLTHEQLAIAQEALDLLQDPLASYVTEVNQHTSDTYSDQAILIAKDLVSDQDFDGGDDDELQLEFRTEPHEDGLAVYHDESINVENAAAFAHVLLHVFDSNESVSISAAYTCSKPQIDQFGGFGAFVTKQGIDWISVTQQLFEKRTAYENRSDAVSGINK